MFGYSKAQKEEDGSSNWKSHWGSVPTASTLMLRTMLSRTPHLSLRSYELIDRDWGYVVKCYLITSCNKLWKEIFDT